jgi:hypothetical protein
VKKKEEIIHKLWVIEPCLIKIWRNCCFLKKINIDNFYGLSVVKIELVKLNTDK